MSEDEKIGNAIIALGCMVVAGAILVVFLIATLVKVWVG